MADNDSNIIKPVEGLYNIAGVTPAKRREERKRRQNFQEEETEEPEHEPNEHLDEQDFDEPGENGNGKSTIDYRA